MSKKILVVDDNFEDLTLTKTFLEKNGYSVVGATNGAQAVDSLKGNGFGLILIDIEMPTLSGYDLLRILREKLNHHTAMAYVTIVPKSEVDMTDVDGFIQKPFSEKMLIKEVKKIIK